MRIIQVSALAFVVLSVGVFAARQFRENSLSSPKSLEGPAGPHKVVVYYFHGTARCTTCRTIEAYTRDALEEKYATALSKGDLEFSPVNVETGENRRFITDFGLTTRSVVIADFKDGHRTRWKKLDQVWDYVSARFQFLEYIQKEVGDYLGSSG
jgi:hypothetical protein